jgi:predicted acetyltransferase
MTTSLVNSVVELEITRALPEQEPILANMLELYAHDFSEFTDITLGPDGRFGYKNLPLYWEDPNRHPFLIKTDGGLAGFALVTKGSDISGDPDVWDMTEFFIVRGFRRLGIGTEATQAIWKNFPGKWEVRVIDRNKKAIKFWRRAIHNFIGQPIEPTSFNKDGAGWHVFSFESH